MQVRAWLQHLLHPVNMWSRFGGHWVRLFRAYETYCWNPVLRQWLSNNSKSGINSDVYKADEKMLP
jgi:hypothetical protein